MAPVILALKADPAFKCVVLATAQHRELLDQVLGLFNITPDYDLDAMEPNQTLPKLTAKLTMTVVVSPCARTTSGFISAKQSSKAMVSALAAFYRKIPYGHIEAGLRTHDLQNPFPEEMNRIVAGHLARWHFAPTTSTRDNLLAEGISDEKITVSGNTVIDALYDVASKPDAPKPDIPAGKRMILVTAHRRENFGKPFENICRAIRAIADEYPDTHFFYPVHPNPNIKSVVDKLLGAHPQITLSEPLDYLPFVGAMKSAYFILSDSGGVQEEAPALGKPVLVLRNETERPEAIEHGSVKLVGTDFEVIVREAKKLLDDSNAYKAMAIGVSPYGDGKAAGRIVNVLKDA